jgi:hypothetical protein
MLEGIHNFNLRKLRIPNKISHGEDYKKFKFVFSKTFAYRRTFLARTLSHG